MTRGTIMRILHQQGFGFVRTADARGDDVFFHGSAVIGTTFEELAEGDEVECEVTLAPKGPRATRLWRRGEVN